MHRPWSLLVSPAEGRGKTADTKLRATNWQDGVMDTWRQRNVGLRGDVRDYACSAQIPEQTRRNEIRLLSQPGKGRQLESSGILSSSVCRASARFKKISARLPQA